MSVWRGAQPLVLASQSSARQMLLKNAGLDFQVAPADLDERSLQAQSGLKEPAAIATLLARAKAAAVAQFYPGHLVVGADQTLALEDAILSKPGDRASAAAQLKRLSGKSHALHSVAAIVRDGEVIFETASIAWLTMRPLSDADIAAYLDAAGDRVTTSVGAYQLEGLGIHLFDRIEGDHFTILGLPLLPLLEFLRGEGLLAF